LTTYDVLVSTELLPSFTDGTARLPAGWRVVETPDPEPEAAWVRVRIEDDNAPAWTEGKLVDPTFTVVTNGLHPTGDVRVGGYVLLVPTEADVGPESMANPGVTVRVGG
jgi:predicted RNA-binding protein with TRAM domain